MTTPSPDAVRAEIEENAQVVGNPIKTAAKLHALSNAILYSDSDSNLATSSVTASKPVYVDSNSVPQTGAFPFEVEIDGSTDTTFSFLNLTGQSSNSAAVLMQGTLVSGSVVTTFTKTGFIRVNITDSGGNLTDGVHYIQLGTLT